MKRIYQPIIVIVMICGLFVSQSFAQDVAFKRSNFSSVDKKLWKGAKKGLRKGDKAFKRGSGMYPLALEHYHNAYKVNKQNALLNYKMGICLLKGMLDTSSLTFLESGMALDPKVNQNRKIKKVALYSKEIFDHNYMLGEANHLKMNWDEAISNFEVYKGALTSYYLSLYGGIIDKQIQECNNGKALTANPARVRIQNLGDSINSLHADYGAFFTGNEGKIIFTSRRPVKKAPGKKKLNKLDNKYFEKIYMAEKKGGVWRKSEVMKRPINAKGQRATAGMSNDGKRLFLYIDKKRKKGGNLYEAKQNKKGNWKKPRKMTRRINSSEVETSIALSYDDEYIYFVSSKKRRKHQGRRDIYYMKRNKRGKRYKRPKNLGPEINTPYAEDYIWAHPDNQTIYFSSRGHNTMGGFDIFKSKRKQDGTWTKPENLSYPINTPEDDYGLVLGWQDRKGYYTSVQPGGVGEKDIHVIKFLGSDKDLIINQSETLLAADEEYLLEPYKDKRNNNAILKGRVSDMITDDPLNAKFIIFDHDLQKNVAIFETTTENNARYMVKLPAGKNYRIIVKSDGYVKHLDNYKIPAKAKELVKDFRLDISSEANDKMTLNKVFFAYNSSKLLSSSSTQLEALAKMMLDNPSMKVEVGGYTDNIGSDAYNQRLSERRAKEVVKFIVKQGVKKDRLVAVGYGEKDPVAGNKTEGGRSKNRRTEFKVLER